MNDWLEVPSVRVIHPGPRHAELLERLVTQNNAAGSMLIDAVLGALALEYGATVASTDQDFSRFTEVKWFNPLAQPGA